MIESFDCPKCGRKLKRSGVVTIAESDFPVFQCDECLRPVEFDGETFDEAYTFALDAGGNPFDPGG